MRAALATLSVLSLAFAACSPHLAAAPVVTVPRAPAAPAATVAPEPPPAPVPSSAPAASAPPDIPSFLVRNASTRYDFRIDMGGPCDEDSSNLDACAGPAVVHVLSKEGAEIQRIELSSVWVALDDAGEPVVDTAALYDTQGTINVGDFDFDGREDFAVQVDHHGPYGGPTFAVFLHDPKAERFVESEGLSQLTRETLGFFRVDAATRRLGTLQKSGCCYHVAEWHEVVRGEPRVVERITDDARSVDGFVVHTEERVVGGRWHKRTRRAPAP